jgi:hypothetical protein
MDPVTAVIAMLLHDFPNTELAALNRSVQVSGTVSPKNIGFQRAQNAGLIDDTGKPVDLEALRDALAFMVDKRVAAGTFV